VTSALAALLVAAPAAAATHVVEVSNFVFSPRVVVIPVGDSVTWINQGGGTHNVIADDRSFRCALGCDGEGGNGDAAPGPWSVTRTFAQPGSVPYFCEVHGAAGGSGMAGRVEVIEAPSTCVAGAQTLCLNGGRFRVEVEWSTVSSTGRGQATPLPDAPDSGFFSFFGPRNVEMLVKVLDACVPPFDRFWVFVAAASDVGYRLTVTDTRSGGSRRYDNPVGRKAVTVTDTDAFATCP